MYKRTVASDPKMAAPHIVLPGRLMTDFAQERMDCSTWQRWTAHGWHPGSQIHEHRRACPEYLTALHLLSAGQQWRGRSHHDAMLGRPRLDTCFKYSRVPGGAGPSASASASGGTNSRCMCPVYICATAR